MDSMMKKILVYLRNVFNVFIAGYAILVGGQYWVMYMDIDYYFTVVPIDKWYAWIAIGVHTGFVIMLVMEYLMVPLLTNLFKKFYKKCND